MSTTFLFFKIFLFKIDFVKNKCYNLYNQKGVNFYMQNTNPYLTEKEIQAMQALWESDVPLSATDIANKINSDWAKKSIQNITRKLEKKGLIEVAEITKLGKTYGRLFKPTITSEEYAINQFNIFYKKDSEIPALISALVGNKSTNKEFTDTLKKLVDKYRGE